MEMNVRKKAKEFDEEEGSLAELVNIPEIKQKVYIVIALFVINVILVVVCFILSYYTVKNVIVEGNQHYSVDAVKAMVMTGYLGDNSLYLSLKYKNKEIEGVPFVDTMDIVVQSNDTIKITVYEKSLAGYIEYLGRYMYFDNEGVIVEEAKIKTKGIPQVIGLSFDHVALYEKIPVENNEVFQNILMITKLLNKYDVPCDKMQFDANNNVMLGYKNIKVDIGSLQNLDEKLMQLPHILPELEGERGTIDLKNYTSDRKSISFEQEK